MLENFLLVGKLLCQTWGSKRSFLGTFSGQTNFEHPKSLLSKMCSVLLNCTLLWLLHLIFILIVNSWVGVNFIMAY